MDIAAATAAPLTIKLDDNNFKLSPLKDRDYGEYERWAQDRHIQIAKRNVEGLEHTLAMGLLKHAYDEATTISIDSEISLRYMKTIEGASQLCYLMLRHKQPEVTYSQVLEWLTDPKNMQEAMEGITRLAHQPEKKE